MKKQSKADTVTNSLTVVLFIIYLIAICWILLFKLGVQFSYMGRRSVNLIPFREPSIVSGENILNIVIFVPLGIYVAMLFKSWTFIKKLLFIFLCSPLIESLQYILRIGAFDVTDIITNTLGGIMGLLMYEVLDKAFTNPANTQKFINLIAAIGTVLMILFLLLLKLNRLPIRYQ